MADAHAALDAARGEHPAPRPRPGNPHWASPPPEGWRKPTTPHDAPHPYFIDLEHHRVICRECLWFMEVVGATLPQLKSMGRRHRKAVLDREQGADQ